MLSSEGCAPGVVRGTKILSNLLDFDFLTLGQKVKPVALEGAAAVASLEVQGIDVEEARAAEELGR